MAALFVFIFAMLATVVYDPRYFDPFLRLLNSTVIDKVNSASGQERSYWNYISLKSFVDTAGLGVGLGSSRASSWPIAVLSQLGLVGAIMLLFLVGYILKGTHGLADPIDPPDDAIVSSVRACALSGLVSASLISGTADPGMIFFISLGVIVVSSMRVTQAERRNRHPRNVARAAATTAINIAEPRSGAA